MSDLRRDADRTFLGDRAGWGRPLLLAAPGLALAAAGLTHPHGLNAETAGWWTVLHLVGAFVFPLVGVALMALMVGRRDPVAWIVVLTAFVYATAYSALDVISGIGAGYITWRLGEGVPRPDEVRFLFSIGGRIGEVGSWALIVCTVVVVLEGLWRHGLLAVPALVAVAGAVLVHRDHIFSPTGALGMLLLGLATGWLGWLRSGSQPGLPDSAASSVT